MSKVSSPNKIKAKYAVTFEFMTRLPVTIRGEVEAGASHTLAMRAIKAARIQAKKPKSIAKYGTIIGWSSISILLDRYDFMKWTLNKTKTEVKDEKETN